MDTGQPAPRFRLRFLFQEFDIVGPEVVLGRSPDCQITIEDPLVSRRHAVIRVTEEGALIEDSGSRNGVRLNGQPLKNPTFLRDGDRIRIGTQELVFFVVNRPQHVVRPTGYMKVCEACDTPFPQGVPSCPHCGAPASQEEETTMSGMVVEPRRTWTLQLLGEVLEKAISLGREKDAQRLMQRCEEEIAHRLKTGEKLLPEQLAQVTTFAIRLAQIQKQSEWAKWALQLYRSHRMLPHDEAISALKKLLAQDASIIDPLQAIIEELLELPQLTTHLTEDERNAADRLQRVFDDFKH